MKKLLLVLVVSGLLLMGCAGQQTYVCANGAEVTDQDLCALMSNTPSDLCSTISLILENADKCDLDAVSVNGTVHELVQPTSELGNRYVTFELIDGPNSLSVFKWGSELLPEGQKVTVTGVFRKQKVVRNYTFFNQIDASEITPSS